ncbi:MAG: hypothetical protein IT334_00540, partial [Thermomicrobiales bacterium]|nr:hypothetical protein [Thermomicrobiales bacterium]
MTLRGTQTRLAQLLTMLFTLCLVVNLSGPVSSAQEAAPTPASAETPTEVATSESNFTPTETAPAAPDEDEPLGFTVESIPATAPPEATTAATDVAESAVSTETSLPSTEDAVPEGTEIAAEPTSETVANLAADAPQSASINLIT